jgi:hypothetical protein
MPGLAGATPAHGGPRYVIRISSGVTIRQKQPPTPAECCPCAVVCVWAAELTPPVEDQHSHTLHTQTHTQCGLQVRASGTTVHLPVWWCSGGDGLSVSCRNTRFTPTPLCGPYHHVRATACHRCLNHGLAASYGMSGRVLALIIPIGSSGLEMKLTLRGGKGQIRRY